MSLDVNSYLNLFDALIIIGVAVPLLLVSSQIKMRSTKTLFILFSSFLLLHGLYHLTYFLGDYTGSDLIAIGNAVVEPVSYALLFSFALYFAWRGG